MYKIHQLANLLFILTCVRGQGVEACGPCKCNRIDPDNLIMICDSVAFLQFVHSDWSPEEHTKINITFQNVDHFTPSYFPEWANSISILEIINSTVLNFDFKKFEILRELTFDNVQGSFNFSFYVPPLDCITIDYYRANCRLWSTVQKHPVIERLVIVNSNYSDIEPIKVCKGLKTLLLDNVRLNEIIKLNNITELRLPRNNIANFEVKNTELTEGSLKVLDLTQNHISIVPADALSRLMKKDSELKTILLQWNKIVYVHPEAFIGYKILKLDLSHNALKSLDGAVVLGAIYNVNLQYNPWRCNSKIQWITDHLFDILNSTYPELLPEIRCDSPLKFKGKQLISWYNNSERFLGKLEDVGTEIKELENLGSSQNLGLFKESAEATNKLADALNRFLDNAENWVNCSSDKSHPLETEMIRSLEALHWHINNTWETPTTLQALMNHSIEISYGSLTKLTQILNILNTTHMQRMSKGDSEETANPLVEALRTENVRLNEGGAMSSGMTTMFTILAIICVALFVIIAILYLKFVFKRSTRKNTSLELLRDSSSLQLA